MLKNSLKIKTLLLYILLILLPFTVIFVFFTISSVNEIKTNYIAFMTDKNSKMNQRVNDIISDVDRVSYLNVMNSNVQAILKKQHRTEGLEYLEDMRGMDNFIIATNMFNPYFYEIIYVANNGQFFSNTGTSSGIKEKIAAWLPKARELKGKKVITEVYSLPGTGRYFSVYRMLRNTDTFKENGFVSINVNLKTISTNLEKNPELTNEASNTIIMQGNEVIYNSEPGEENENTLDAATTSNINAAWGNSSSFTGALLISGRKSLVVGTTNEITQWKLIQYMPYSTIDRYIRKSLFFYGCIMIPLLIVMIVLGYFLTVHILNPIELLKKCMKKVETGHWMKVEEKIRGHEMDGLICSYNHMVEQLQESIREKYINEVNQKKMELKMLEAQINPHFLYNTLTMISSIAEIEGVEDICIISSCLSDMFRYNIRKGSIIKVHEEMEQIKNYISIQNLRFKEKIDFQYSIDEKIEHYQMLKFLLQPIVENAIYHGIEKKAGRSGLIIDFEEENQILTVTIKDEGVGMSCQDLEELNNRLSQKRGNYFLQDRFEHIGLENVHFRIKDYYGEQFGLQINSWEGKGTEVKIIIPVVNEG